MAGEYPKWNDNEIDLLRKLATNSAALADAEAGDVASIVAGTGISVNQPTGVVTITNTGVLSVTGTANEITASPTTGAVVVSLPAALTFTGKTITGGTFTGGTYSGSSFTDSGLTATRVVFAGVGGLLSDDADLTFVTDTLTFTKGVVPTSLIVGAAAGSTPSTELEVDSTSTSSPRGIMSAQFNTGTDGARFHGRKARGTRASPLTVVSGDNLTRWVGSGYDGSNYLEMASIIFGTEGTIAATRVPTNIQFWTATNAAPSVLTQWETIFSNGNHTFGGLTTNGTGVIQLASASTAAGGITFGTDLNFYRTSASTVTLKAASTSVQLSLDTTGGSTGTNIIFGSNGSSRWTVGHAVTGSGTAFEIYNNAGTSALALSIASATSRITLAQGMVIPTTNTLQFGVTASALVNVTADTTAGVFTFTCPSSGSFDWRQSGSIMTLSGSGALSTNGSIFSGSAFVAANGGGIGWLTRSTFASTSNGEVINFLNDGATIGFLKTKLRASNGTAGANFGPAAVASITVVDGVITAIS